MKGVLKKSATGVKKKGAKRKGIGKVEEPVTQTPAQDDASSAEQSAEQRAEQSDDRSNDGSNDGSEAEVTAEEARMGKAATAALGETLVPVPPVTSSYVSDGRVAKRPKVIVVLERACLETGKVNPTQILHM